MRAVRTLVYWLAAMAIWLLLTWSVSWPSIAVGAVLSLITAVVFGGELPLEPIRLLNPTRWFWLLIYVPVFAYQCFKANLDVALRVLSPGLALRPGVVKIRTSLKSNLARTFLANSITLLRGR